MPVSLAAVRDRIQHYMSEEVAQVAGLRLENLFGLVGGTFRPTDEQLEKLARRIHLKE